jgi:hypothetical protein|tara:strand:- start:8488 stop:9552 length:1065 start_codon:yes stop_codon:yes gene_type:complete
MAESGYKLNKEGKPLHTLENWKQGGKSGDNPWLYSDDLNFEGWKNWGNDFFVGQPDYDFTGLPEGSTYKDYMFELQRSRQPENYNNGLGKKSKQEETEILADINRLFPNRKKDDLFKGPNIHKGEREDRLNIRRALQEGKEKLAEKEIAEAKRLADIEANTLGGRLRSAWNDADKRDAILGGISETMLETRVGADAYGNRFAALPGNVRDNLKMAEATTIARNKAQVDAMKVLAETQKMLDPRQYLTNAQTEADSYVRAQIRSGKINAEDYDSAYARMLKQIAVKDLTSAKSGSIKDLYTYAMALQSTDPVTAGILMDAIKSNAMYLAGDGTEFGAQTDTANEIIVKDTVTTTN